MPSYAPPVCAPLTVTAVMSAGTWNVPNWLRRIAKIPAVATPVAVLPTETLDVKAPHVKIVCAPNHQAVVKWLGWENVQRLPKTVVIHFAFVEPTRKMKRREGNQTRKAPQKEMVKQEGRPQLKEGKFPQKGERGKSLWGQTSPTVPAALNREPQGAEDVHAKPVCVTLTPTAVTWNGIQSVQTPVYLNAVGAPQSNP